MLRLTKELCIAFRFVFKCIKYISLQINCNSFKSSFAVSIFLYGFHSTFIVSFWPFLNCCCFFASFFSVLFRLDYYYNIGVSRLFIIFFFCNSLPSIYCECVDRFVYKTVHIMQLTFRHYATSTPQYYIYEVCTVYMFKNMHIFFLFSLLFSHSIVFCFSIDWYWIVRWIRYIVYVKKNLLIIISVQQSKIHWSKRHYIYAIIAYSLTKKKKIQDRDFTVHKRMKYMHWSSNALSAWAW